MFTAVIVPPIVSRPSSLEVWHLVLGSTGMLSTLDVGSCSVVLSLCLAAVTPDCSAPALMQRRLMVLVSTGAG